MKTLLSKLGVRLDPTNGRKQSCPAPSLSLYIHIPFCVRECRYCDFYSTARSSSLIDAYIDSVIREKDRSFERYQLQSSSISTIYFGGGTPSILSARQWKRLTNGLFKELSIQPSAEISVECNPESFKKDKAEAWLDSGVNRITFGIQSLDDRLLRFLGRPHTGELALSVIADPLLDRFASIGADVMFGLPGQTIQALESTLDALLAIGRISHLSAYELTINEHSPFGRHHRCLPLPNEEAVAAMTDLVIDKCEQAGFERYEVSNFAKPHFRSQHNSAYWHHLPYLGLGPSAHSYIHPHRWANIPDLMTYLSMVEAGKAPHAFVEEITKEQLVTEAIMLGLRTADGIDTARFEELTGETFLAEKRAEAVRRLVDQGLLGREGSRYFPTEKGMMVADGLAREMV